MHENYEDSRFNRQCQNNLWVFALEGLKTYQVKMLTYVKNRINSCISVASQNKGLK